MDRNNFIIDLTDEEFERLVDATWEEYNKEDLLADMIEEDEE